MIEAIILAVALYMAYKLGQAAGHNEARSEMAKAPAKKSNCADPVSYCDNCSCGKKAKVIASLEIKRK